MSRPLLAIFLAALAVLVDVAFGYHHDVLRADPVGRPLGNAGHGNTCIVQRLGCFPRQVESLCRRERRARNIAFGGIDRAKLKPCKGVFPVALNGISQDFLGFGVIRPILGRDQGVPEQGGNERLVVGPLNGIAQYRQRILWAP